MQNKPLASVIMPFYNTPPAFMHEAIESVLNQTYTNWELLLIDDGSNQANVDIALEYERKYPKKIRCYQHEGHMNRGIGASRQLGIENARGEYVSFLDADDVWLAHKLNEQIDIMERNPYTAMLSSSSLYWYSWEGTPESEQWDHIPKIGTKFNGIVQPPLLLAHFLSGKISVPCPSSILLRKRFFNEVSWYEDGFPGANEDQVFYAKICLIAPIFVSTSVWDKYRQHSASMCAISESDGKTQADRIRYLQWLEQYLIQHRCRDRRVWQSLKRERWHLSSYESVSLSNSQKKIITRLKKWLLRLEQIFLPFAIRRWIWLHRVEIGE
jgi:glycosyltransferase involved in cell wall biosynthesis